MAKGKVKSEPTRYVVLERVKGIRVEPTESATGDPPSETREVEVEAWAPVPDEDGQPRVFAGGRDQVVRQHTGNGADVIEGDWKRVPLSSWNGGERTRRTVQAERLPLE